MFQELKFQLSTAILTILTLAAGVATVVNFEQYEHFRIPDDGVIWVDRTGHVEALYGAPDGPAANWVQPGDWLISIGREPTNPPGTIGQPEAMAPCGSAAREWDRATWCKRGVRAPCRIWPRDYPSMGERCTCACGRWSTAPGRLTT